MTVEPLQRPISDREREVLVCVCDDGLSCAQTAERLFISPETVRNHLTNVRKLIGARSTNQACGMFCRAQERRE